VRILAQVFSAVLVIGFIWWGIDNVITAASQRGLSLDFRFLEQSAGFPISEPPIPYDPSRSFLYAFFIGILNTLKVSILGIIFATLRHSGQTAQLSSNWLVNRLALAFIEIHRNIPRWCCSSFGTAEFSSSCPRSETASSGQDRSI
jgi:general L-amino acid transport system permease protein